MINLYADSRVDEDEHSDQKADVWKEPTNLVDTIGNFIVERMQFCMHNFDAFIGALSVPLQGISERTDPLVNQLE